MVGPALIANNVVRVVMQYAGGGAEMSNVYHVHKDTDWTPAQLATLEDAFVGWESDTAGDNRSQNVELVRITLTDLTSQTSDTRDTIMGAPIPGKRVSPLMPGNVTVAVKGSIGERGRGRSGRTFWIGLAEDMCVGCSITSPIGADVVANLNQLRTEIAGLAMGAVLGIIHTVKDGAPLTPATFSEIITYALTDYILDSMRDRLPNHKRKKRTATP